MKIVYAFVASVPFVVAGCHSAQGFADAKNRIGRAGGVDLGQCGRDGCAVAAGAVSGACSCRR